MTKLKKFQTRKDLRGNSNIKENWKESVQSLINTLADRVMRLKLKDVPFKV